MKIVKGDLIKLALQGEFDYIAHGCNCFNRQKSGIAKQMVATFGTDKFEMENWLAGAINKLGCNDGRMFRVDGKYAHPDNNGNLGVLNCYTQYNYGRDGKRYVDYDALRLCMRKLNHEFAGSKIGLPKIGCGLAGGDWAVVRGIIEEELKNCDVTIVEYEN